MMKVKHYGSTPLKENGKIVGHKTKCGSSVMGFNVVKAATLVQVTCPECILSLMTMYEEKICVLEERYNTLFPNRPVGEKLQ